MAIIVTPNMMSGSTVYTTTTNVVQQTAQSTNPYLKSCNGQACTGYTAVTKCGIDIWQGVRACQTIYLIDKEGNLVDTDRLDYVNVTVENIFGCNVYWFDSRGTEDTNPIEFLQSKFDGEMLRINADNFNDIMFGSNSPMFDVDEDSIFLENGMIRVVSENCSTPFITVPLEYSEHIGVTLNIAGEGEDSSSGSGSGTGPVPTTVPKLVMRANGSPNIVRSGETTELIILTESEDGCVLEFGLDGKGDFILEDMVFTTNAGVSNKGAIRICFEDYETKELVPSVLTATVMFKFKDDDEVEQGSVQVVKCVPIGTVRKNTTLDGGNDTPVISHKVRPEHIEYDNSKSGLESTNMADATMEIKGKVDRSAGKTRYEGEYSCSYDGERKRYFWDVKHDLNLHLTAHANGEVRALGTRVSIFGEGSVPAEGDVEHIDQNRLTVWFTECVNGRIIIEIL